MTDISDNFLFIKSNEKRNRKSNAVKLPLEVTENMIPKYVVYYKECYNQQSKSFREFFKIEKHPKMETKKVLTSSKSNKITILEKLSQIKEILKSVENGDYLKKTDDQFDNKEDTNINNENLTTKKMILPKYISIKPHEIDSDKMYFVYDKKTNDKRETCKAIIKKSDDISHKLNVFLEKIKEKYN